MEFIKDLKDIYFLINFNYDKFEYDRMINNNV